MNRLLLPLLALAIVVLSSERANAVIVPVYLLAVWWLWRAPRVPAEGRP